MRRRLVGLVASVTLAAFGTVVLVGYVQSAHNTAAAAEPMNSVVVVTQRIPRGTKASDLAGKVKIKQIPASATVKGAVHSTAEIDGTDVASTDLMPDEQVLADRFQKPAMLGRQGVPDGLLEVTVKLDPERAVGGTIRPGDSVAVVSSFKPFDSQDVAGADPNAPKKSPNTTHVILHKVLVTNVQLASTSTQTAKTTDAKKPDDGTPDSAPKGQFLVTLALDATSVQRVVFTAEFGSLWLSAEPSDSPDGQTRVETLGTVN
jgi:pilus assembly protein CpaB